MAIARSLITQPQIVLADEPTAALDYRNSEDLLNLFEDINLDGQTILMVTHSANAASHAKRVLFIKDGRIFHQLYKAGKSNQDFAKEISLNMSALLGVSRCFTSNLLGKISENPWVFCSLCFSQSCAIYSDLFHVLAHAESSNEDHGLRCHFYRSWRDCSDHFLGHYGNI